MLGGLAMAVAGLAAASFDEMNGEYSFANQLPGTKAVHRGQAYFDVESEIQNTTYGLVNWRTHQIDIDPATVSLLKGKLVNFVGYEFDIRRILPNGTETSARAWEQYNHHYGNTVMGSSVKLVKTGMPDSHEPMAHLDDAAKTFPGYRIVPAYTEGNLRGPAGAYSSQALIMGNGAESRKTFHYIPPGYGAKVRSPYQVVMHPMIIDTANRDPAMDTGTDPERTRHGIVPPQANVGPGAMYNGMMECPCTDRYPKKLSTYSTLKSGTCNPVVTTAADCQAAARELGLVPLVNASTVNNGALPTGCSVQPTVGGFDVVFNTAQNAASCGAPKAQGPVLPQACNLTGAWISHQKTTLRFVPGLETNTYIVRAEPQGTIRAHINMSMPTASAPQGALSGDWISAKDKSITRIPATITTYSAQSATSVPPCTELDWGNGVVMIKAPFDKLPAKPAPGPRVTALGEDLVNVSVDVDQAKDLVTIKVSGPAAVWFGVGIGAATHAADPSDPSIGLSMLGTNWTVVVLGNGTVEERKLGNHEAGVRLPQTVTVVSENVVDGVRTVVLTRPIKGPHYTFDASQNSLAFINAIGASADFGYHVNKSSALMYFVEADAPTCICDVAADQGTLGGFAWGNQRCLPRPLGQMLDDPGWRNITGGINPTCSLKYYKGGLRCCKDGSILLNKNQTISPAVYQYKLRYRYYYEVVEEAAVQPIDTIRSSWWTEHLNNEHDVPPCFEDNKSKCVYEISSNFTAGMMAGCSNGCKMIHMEGHCHIGCIRMEMWIMDDPSKPQLLCRTKVNYGTGDSWMNETGYIGGNEPCIFGNPKDGFQAPVALRPTTKLMSLKFQNNTVPRYGDMALWELRAAAL